MFINQFCKAMNIYTTISLNILFLVSLKSNFKTVKYLLQTFTSQMEDNNIISILRFNIHTQKQRIKTMSRNARRLLITIKLCTTSFRAVSFVKSTICSWNTVKISKRGIIVTQRRALRVSV